MKQKNLFDNDLRDYFSDLLQSLEIDEQKYSSDLFGARLHSWAKGTVRNIKVVSIFSGAGGLDIGFRDAGFDVVSHLEIEKDFCTSLDLNSSYYNNAEVINIDIRDFQPNLDENCDFIIGGPPCQTFSAAGRRAAGVQGTDDSRGTLFEEYVRLLLLYKPKGFLFENVYGITGAQSGTAWEQIKHEFEKAGYNISFRVLNTADFGVPQFRERLIIVGFRNGRYQFPRPTHGPDSANGRNYFSAKQAIDGVEQVEDVEKLRLNGRHGHLLADIPPGLNYSYYTENLGHPQPIFAWRSKFSDYLYKADPTKPVRTIKAQGGQYTGPLHWENRHFTVNEYKRLQTFPDSYQISGNRQKVIHQIGNSVPPQFARFLALSILDQLFEVKIPFQFDYLSPTEELSFRKRKRDLTAENLKAARRANKGKKLNDNYRTEKIHVFSISVTKNFKTTVSEKDVENVKIFSEGSDLILEYGTNRGESPDYTIVITPTNISLWNLDYKSVEIRSFDSSVWSFVESIRAFEYFIKSEKIKDDIVQMNGYYQYEPRILMQLKADNLDGTDAEVWKILVALFNSIPVRKIISYKEFGAILGVPITIIPDVAVTLKNLGYEIRNHNTNPQIKKDHILLPYIFPTLSNLSVQLRKKL